MIYIYMEKLNAFHLGSYCSFLLEYIKISAPVGQITFEMTRSLYHLMNQMKAKSLIKHNIDL